MSSQPRTVALTGGLASGKSTVAAGLAARGAAVIDADQVVHQLYQPKARGTEQVRALFGATILAPDGSVDRTALGQQVLASSEALQQLNQTIHPLVRDRITSWIKELRALSPMPLLAVVEAALLIETGSYRQYDLLVVVWCRPEQQLTRAIARGVDAQRAHQLLAAQLPLDQKRRLADVVIDNSGCPAELKKGLDHTYQQLLSSPLPTPKPKAER